MTPFEHAISMDILYKCWQKVSMKSTNVGTRADGAAATGATGAVGAAGVGASAGIDGIDISLYRTDLQKNLRSLQASVANNKYEPYSEKTYTNRKGRNISISCIDEKILQTALSKTISLSYIPAGSVHGFIPKRSIYTAKKYLDTAIANGILEYSKVDIENFYDSIDIQILRRKIELLINDARFINLVNILLGTHRPGISTGSCLSPVLANLYLSDTDRIIEKSSAFYSRYVDDMLVAPADNINLIESNLANIGLEINAEKSKTVSVTDGFTYLGFDIQQAVDNAILSGNFALANKIYETQESDISAEPPEDAQQAQSPQDKAEFAAVPQNAGSTDYAAPNAAVTNYTVPGAAIKEYAEPSAANVEHTATTNTMRAEYALPNTILNVIRKCHFVSEIIEKIRCEHYIGLADKTLLLQIFHCLGDEGTKYIHHILSNCSDYDYAETQRRIKNYKVSNPVGCKKICERMGGSDKCACNFTNEKIYPTPIIHALRVDSKCFKPIPLKNNIGHFRAKNPQDKAADALSAILDLNKKLYEITEQKSIFKGQIEDLFDRLNSSEYHTPQGLLIKNDDGIFIKVC